jgi:rubredoxin
MRVIEEHRKDLEPKKSKKYIYRCDICGSTLEVDSEDIHDEQAWGDIEEYFTCPVCKHRCTIFLIKLFHLKSLRKIFNKKYR